MVSERAGYYFGNADDGDMIHAHVGRDGDRADTVLLDASGERLFLSRARMTDVTLSEP